MLKYNSKANKNPIKQPPQSIVAEMSVAATPMITSIIASSTEGYNPLFKFNPVSIYMLKIMNGKMYLVDSKTSRPMVKFDVKTGEFETVKRYEGNEDRCNKVLNWISKMHESVLTIFKSELTTIHNKSYPDGKTSAV